jgi:hypothetical protein
VEGASSLANVEHFASALEKWLGICHPTREECGRGGIGRRASLRSLWGQPRDGSTPFARTRGKKQKTNPKSQAIFKRQNPNAGLVLEFWSLLVIWFLSFF